MTLQICSNDFRSVALTISFLSFLNVYAFAHSHTHLHIKGRFVGDVIIKDGQCTKNYFLQFYNDNCHHTQVKAASIYVSVQLQVCLQHLCSIYTCGSHVHTCGSHAHPYLVSRVKVRMTCGPSPSFVCKCSLIKC